MNIKIVFTILVTLLFGLPVHALSVTVDDTLVAKDNNYPSCLWSHCKKKAKKLKEDYLFTQIKSQLESKGNYSVFRNTNISEKYLKVIIQSDVKSEAKGVGKFVASTLSFGAAPVEHRVKFNVSLEYWNRNKVEISKSFNFIKKRNVSILSDTQSYNKSVSKVIVNEVLEFVKTRIK